MSGSGLKDCITTSMLFQTIDESVGGTTCDKWYKVSTQTHAPHDFILTCCCHRSCQMDHKQVTAQCPMPLTKPSVRTIRWKTSVVWLIWKILRRVAAGLAETTSRTQMG